MVGEEASKLSSMLEISHPIENGIINNWEDMKHLWDYTFNEKLQITTRNSKVPFYLCIPKWDCIHVHILLLCAFRFCFLSHQGTLKRIEKR